MTHIHSHNARGKRGQPRACDTQINKQLPGDAPPSTWVRDYTLYTRAYTHTCTRTRTRTRTGTGTGTETETGTETKTDSLSRKHTFRYLTKKECHYDNMTPDQENS